MQCMQNLKINYIDATSFTKHSLGNTLHFPLYFPRFAVARRLDVVCFWQELCHQRWRTYSISAKQRNKFLCYALDFS